MYQHSIPIPSQKVKCESVERDTVRQRETETERVRDTNRETEIETEKTVRNNRDRERA